MADFRIGSLSLGDKIFYSEKWDRYVLAKDAVKAKHILSQLRLEEPTMKLVCTLTEASNILHRGGSHVYVISGSKEYIADTLLVYGSPRGMDSIHPLKVTYVGD